MPTIYRFYADHMQIHADRLSVTDWLYDRVFKELVSAFAEGLGGRYKVTKIVGERDENVDKMSRH